MPFSDVCNFFFELAQVTFYQPLLPNSAKMLTFFLHIYKTLYYFFEILHNTIYGRCNYATASNVIFAILWP